MGDIQNLFELKSLADSALLVALACTRVAVACMLMPLFAPEVVPALIRNAIFMVFGILTLALQPSLQVSSWGLWDWMAIFAKEVTLGVLLGFGLAAFFWAFEAAGQIVDTKVGTAGLQLADPLSGHQVSGSAALLGRFIGFLFMASGGFLLFVGMLLESFGLWPIGDFELNPQRLEIFLFQQQFSDFISVAMLVAAPSLLLMFAIDMILGLVNRFAPQINLLSVSASLKGLAAITVWMMILGTLSHRFLEGFGFRIRKLVLDVSVLIAN